MPAQGHSVFVSSLTDIARRALVSSVIFVAVVAGAIALWKVRIIIALVFLGIIIAAAMRPGVDFFERRLHLPRIIGILIHYLLILAAIAFFLWQIVPVIAEQVNTALAAGNLQHSVTHSSGIKHQALKEIQDYLNRLPSGSSLIHPAITVTLAAFEILIGIFLTFAVAAYWIFERDRAIDLVVRLAKEERRHAIRDTWDLIDAKLGAFVRGELLLIAFVGTTLSLLFFAVSEPYWLLVGIFAGLVEIIPIVGPLAAGAVAIGAGFTQSWQTALLAGLCVLGVRLFQDYVISPRVLGRAVGLSPLLAILAATMAPLIFGAFYILLALPLLAVLVTVFEVVVLDKTPHPPKAVRRRVWKRKKKMDASKEG